MEIEEVGVDQVVGRLLFGGGPLSVSCAREAADVHAESAAQAEAIESMLDAFDRARGALENMANLVTFSARRRAGWRCEPEVGAARERLLSSQREALELAEQVLASARASHPA